MTKKVLAVILALAMALSVMSVCVSAIPSPMSPMAPVGNFSLAINIGSDEYHGLFIGGALVPLPHSFSGDTCVNCGYVKPAEEEEEPEEEPVKEETKPAKKVLKYTPSKDSVYVLEKTGGQDFDDKTVAGGLELVTSNGRTRLATSWQSSGVVYTEMVNALKDNTDCVIKITYTGTITAFGIESENAGIIDVDCETVKGDDFNVMTVSVADFLETGSAAVADTGWRNIYVVAEDGAKLYGFEITPPSEIKSTAKSEPKEEPKPAAKEETKAETKPAAAKEPKAEGDSRVVTASDKWASHTDALYDAEEDCLIINASKTLLVHIPTDVKSSTLEVVVKSLTVNGKEIPFSDLSKATINVYPTVQGYDGTDRDEVDILEWVEIACDADGKISYTCKTDDLSKLDGFDEYVFEIYMEVYDSGYDWNDECYINYNYRIITK